MLLQKGKFKIWEKIKCKNLNFKANREIAKSLSIDPIKLSKKSKKMRNILNIANKLKKNKSITT